MRYLFAGLLSLLWLLSTGLINPQADKTKEGNRLYQEEKYDEAMSKYTEALIDLPESPELHFNIGDASYKKSDYEEAIKSYNKALASGEPTLEGKANYNLGNCKFRQGKLKENTNLSEAIGLYRDAIDYYKRAIELNPDDKDAKFNHELIEKKIKELMSKPKEEQEEKKEQNQQKERKQQESKTGKGEEEKSEEQEERKPEEAKPQEKEKPEPPPGEEKKKEMSAEEAKALLDSIKDEEAKEIKRRREAGRFPEVYKDW